MSAAAPAAARPSLRRSPGLRRLRAYLRHNLRTYAIWTLATLGYVVTFVAVPLLVGWAIAAAEQGLPPAELGRRCLVLALATGLRFALRYSSRTLVFHAAREIEYELRNDLFAQLQRLPQSFYFRSRTGDLMSRCVNDLGSVRLLLGPGVLNLLQTPILFAATLGAMLWLDPKLALLVLMPYPLFIAIARGFGRSLHRANLGVQEGLASLSNDLQEAISGIAVVKSYAMEDAMSARFARANDALLSRQLDLVRVNAAMPPVLSLLPAAAMWIVLFLGGRAVTRGEMSVASFFTYSMYVYELTFPTFIMGWVVALLQRGAAAMQRIDEILSLVPSIADRPDVVPVSELRGEIELRGLTFRFAGADGRPPALVDVSLHVPAGTSLGVVGAVGSGKSTLASVIPRLYEVPDGRVFVDGVDVNRIPLAVLRRGIAMVPQDAFLFSMTLAENVAYGAPDASRAEIEEAAARAQLLRDVAELPQGWETIVGERGVMLSGGQRQRTALARALLRRPRVLILDDTLSSVDAATEAAIQHGLREVFSGRTVVVIAHRTSAVRECDQIVVLDEGRLIERGTHDALVAAGGAYARLVRQQALEEELEAVAVGGGR